jgi:hypothetical protein
MGRPFECYASVFPYVHFFFVSLRVSFLRSNVYQSGRALKRSALERTCSTIAPSLTLVFQSNGICPVSGGMLPS